MKVFILVIENDSGVDVSPHVTREGATLDLYNYVQIYWSEAALDTAIPEDASEAIEIYFEDNDLDSYSIHERTVKGALPDIPGDVDLDEDEIKIVLEALTGLAEYLFEQSPGVFAAEKHARVEAIYNKLKD